MNLSLALVFLLISVAVAGGKNPKKSGNGKKPSAVKENLEGNSKDAKINSKPENVRLPIAYLRGIYEFFMGKPRNKRYKNINTYIGLRKVCNIRYVLTKTQAMDLFDFNFNGLLSKDEFIEAFVPFAFNEGFDFKGVGMKLNDNMIIFKAADQNKDGSLDKQEFQAMMVPFCFERMHKAIIDQLLHYDYNNDKAISKEEIVDMMGRMPHKYLWERIEAVFHSYDADRTGHLEKEEIFEWQLAAYRMRFQPSNLLKKVMDRSSIIGLEYPDDADEVFDEEMRRASLHNEFKYDYHWYA